MITFACPSCQHQLKVKDEMAGKRGRCPNCRQFALVPGRLAPGASVSDNPTLAPANAAPPRDPETLAPSGVVNRSVADANTSPGAAGAAAADPKKLAVDLLAPAQAADELGRLGHYRVLEVLGVGGMGIVFKGEDPRLKRPVALKAMLPALASEGANRQRFQREAQAAASINHDHIVTIYEVGEERGVPFFAMQFLEGEPLDQRLQREGRLSAAEALRIGREIADGLAAAHGRGLIHRDIKPANIWLEGQRRRVKVLDFGLARPASDTTHLTQQGAIIGTPAYMAPEQVRGKNMDGRCDLFSLGCVLYRMCTGSLPFDGDDTLAILLALATHVPPPIDQLNPEVPHALADLVQRLLAKVPEDRPATATVVAEEIVRIETGESGMVPAPRSEAGQARTMPAATKRPMQAGRAQTQVVRRGDVKERPRITDERDEEPDRKPRGKKKGRRRQGAPVGLWIGLGAGSVAVVAVVAIVVLGLLRRAESGPGAMNGAGGSAPTSQEWPTATSPQQPTRTSPTPQPVPFVRGGPTPLDRLGPAAIAGVDGIPGVVAVLRRDGGEAWRVAFSPDGKYVASAGKDQRLCLWDTSRLDNGPTVLSPRADGGVVFSADSKRLVCSSPGVRGWDLTLSAPFSVLDRLPGRPTIRSAPDGKTLAVGDGSGDIRLLDTGVSPAKLVHRWHAHSKGVRDLAFNRDGSILAGCGDDGSVTRWDLRATPPKRLEAIDNGSPCLCVALMADGQEVVFGDQAGRVHHWLFQGSRAIDHWDKKGHEQWASGIVATPDGKRVISSEGGSSSRGPHVAIVWDAAKGKILQEWPLPDACAGLAIDSTGRYLALGCHNSKVYIVRLEP